MKANNLMVGDWVMVNDIEHTHPLQVAEIFMKSGAYYATLYWDGMPDNVNPETLTADVDKVLPIPLTTDILEKNGFEDIGDDIYQLEEKPCWFWVDFYNHTYGCEYDTSTYEYEDDEHRLKLYGIPSVHELQHALRLCGVEKEIEL